MKDNEPVYRIEAVATHETDKGLRVEISGGIAEFLPKSHIHDDSEVQHVGDAGELVCSLWIARQKGWA